MSRYLITVHGFVDWYPTISQFLDMLNTQYTGASQECSVSVGRETKTVREWQKDSEVLKKIGVV